MLTVGLTVCLSGNFFCRTGYIEFFNRQHRELGRDQEDGLTKLLPILDKSIVNNPAVM